MKQREKEQDNCYLKTFKNGKHNLVIQQAIVFFLPNFYLFKIANMHLIDDVQGCPKKVYDVI